MWTHINTRTHVGKTFNEVGKRVFNSISDGNWKVVKKEGQIDWKVGAPKIIGKINGLFPYPGAFFNFNGERYKILKAEIGSGVGEVGEVISDTLEVACGNNQTIKILEIQREGKNPQKISEFLLGSRIKKGSIIPNV